MKNVIPHQLRASIFPYTGRPPLLGSGLDHSLTANVTNWENFTKN